MDLRPVSLAFVWAELADRIMQLDSFWLAQQSRRVLTP
jgi:hypothetical protein